MKSPNSEALRERLNKKRGALRALARDIGVSPGTVCRWASGVDAPLLRSRRKLSRKLGLSIDGWDAAGESNGG